MYYCPDFFTNIVLLSILWRKGAFFDGLYNIINFVKNWAEVAYTLYINGLSLFILADNSVKVMDLVTKRPRLYKELPTKEAVLEVFWALQEGCEAF